MISPLLLYYINCRILYLDYLPWRIYGFWELYLATRQWYSLCLG